MGIILSGIRKYILKVKIGHHFLMKVSLIKVVISNCGLHLRKYQNILQRNVKKIIQTGEIYSFHIFHYFDSQLS